MSYQETTFLRCAPRPRLLAPCTRRLQPGIWSGGAPGAWASHEMPKRLCFWLHVIQVVCVWCAGLLRHSRMHSFDIPLALVTSLRIGSLQNDRVCFTRGNGAWEDNRAGVFSGYRICGALLRSETLTAPACGGLALLKQVRRLTFLYIVFACLRSAPEGCAALAGYVSYAGYAIRE